MFNFLKDMFAAIVIIALVVSVIVGGYILGILLSVVGILGIGYFLVSEYRKSKSKVVEKVKPD